MRHILLAIATLSIASCASTPDVTVSYYPSRGDVDYRVTRTIACDANDVPIIANHVTATTRHSADTSGAPLGQINLKDIDGVLANGEMKVELYPDGRLKGLNATTTGQGETVISSAISLASAAGLLVSPSPAECKFVRDTGKGKPLTLVFTKTVAPTAGASFEVPVEAATSFYYSKLVSVLGKVCVSYGAKSRSVAPAASRARKSDSVLPLVQPGRLEANLGVDFAGSCTSSANVFWKGEHLLGQFGAKYSLLIPQAALFGKQNFEASFDPSGALTSVTYAKETGAGQLLKVGDSALEELGGEGETAAEQAARIKAEADIIAQQQRLVRCQANPTDCT